MTTVIRLEGIHNVFKISAALHWEGESQRFSVEDCADLKKILHFYSMRVTQFSTTMAEFHKQIIISDSATESLAEVSLQHTHPVEHPVSNYDRNS